MFLRMLRGAAGRRKGRFFLTAGVVGLGISLATAMLSVMLDVGDKMNQTLKTYGANIMVTPRGASLLADLYGLRESADVDGQYLREEELPRIKTIFWAFNIVDFAPWLEAQGTIRTPEADTQVGLLGTWFDKHLDIPTGESLNTGIRNLKSWWTLRGDWPEDGGNSLMVGEALASRAGLKPGGSLSLAVRDVQGRETVENFMVSAVFHSGDKEDETLILPLDALQRLSGLQGKARRLEVSALTTPENELARRAAASPAALSAQEWEVWYCTAYVSAIAYQIEEVLTEARAKPVLRVSESEGNILLKTQLLMLLLTLLSLLCSSLAVSSLVTAGVLERAAELGLLKALGATDIQVVIVFLAEMLLAAFLGGTLGYCAGLGLAQVIGRSVFEASIDPRMLVVPITVLLTLLVTLAGSLPALRLLLRLNPAEVLHGR